MRCSYMIQRKVNQSTQSESSDNIGSCEEIDDRLECGSTETEQKGIMFRSIFEIWANKIVMLPFDIAIALLAASCTQNQKDNPFLATISFPYQLFSFILMLAFYASLTGIILLPVFPKLARGFYLLGFFCVLAAVTIFFSALLPSHLNDAPWICLVFVLFIVFGLALYEQCG